MECYFLSYIMFYRTFKSTLTVLHPLLFTCQLWNENYTCVIEIKQSMQYYANSFTHHFYSHKAKNIEAYLAFGYVFGVKYS